MSSLPNLVEFSIVRDQQTKYLSAEGDNIIIYKNDRGDGEQSKFVVVPGPNGNVHLQHFATKKYLVKATYTKYIYADSAEPVEDVTNPQCTLFRATIKNNNMVSFVHVHSGQPICLYRINYASNPSDFWVLESRRGAVPLETVFTSLTPLPDDVPLETKFTSQTPLRTMSLPAFVSFYQDHNNFYLASFGDKNIPRYYAHEYATSPHTRYAVERAEKGDGLVHLRNCYFNKYLIKDGQWVTATASEKEEDEARPECTLFRPLDINGKVEFIHVATDSPIRLPSSGHPYWVLRDNDVVPCRTSFFDLESLVSLPKRVVFKGNNDKYLGYISGGETADKLKFEYGDIADPRAQFEIHFHRDGHTLIKCLYNNRFCQFGLANGFSILIHPIAMNGNNSRTWFTVVEGPNGTFGIRHALTYPELDNESLFLGRGESSSIRDYFCFVASAMVPQVQLTVEEAVVSRTIWVDYRFDSSRIFGAKPLVAASASVANHSQIAHQTQLNVSFTKSRTANWSVGGSYRFGFKTSIKGSVPFIAEKSIEISHEVEIHAEAGGSVSKEETVSNTQIVNLPGRSIATATVMATMGNCDIPFSYRQVDLLYNGQRVETVLHDGVYENVNNYDFHTIIHIIDMDSTEPNTWNILDAYAKAVEESRVEHKGVPKMLESNISAKQLPKWEYEEPIIEESPTKALSIEELQAKMQMVVAKFEIEVPKPDDPKVEQPKEEDLRNEDAEN